MEDHAQRLENEMLNISVLDGVRAMLVLAGEDPDRPGLRDTPRRFLKAWLELTGSPGNPQELLSVMFADVGVVEDMVAVGPIPFSSICEHHLLPFSGVAWIAYLPIEGVVGLSKIPRLLEHFARRPQVQERLTAQVVDALDKFVPNEGVAAVLTALHSCATLRGVKNSAPMTTSRMVGAFRDKPAARAEFLALTRRVEQQA